MNEAELRAGCPPELLGTEVPRYVEQLLSTENVFRQDGLFLATPRTFGCARSTRPKPTTRWFIASANRPNTAQMFLESKGRGPFIPLPEGRRTLALSL